MANRVMQGKVIRDQNDKTIVVQVEVTKMHPKYGKRIRLHKKFHVHDEANQYKVGDAVKFMSCRPISKLKKWTTCSEGGCK